MRCAICDAKLPMGHRLDDDICPVCAHEIRKALDIGILTDERTLLEIENKVRGEIYGEEESEEP